MFHANKSRLIFAGTMLVLTGLLGACETDVQREMRLEREALKNSGELEELQQQLDTVNPDPYVLTPTNPNRRRRRK